MLDEFYQPCVVDRLKEATNVRIEHPVDRARFDSHRHRVQCIMRAAARSKSVGKTPKVPLVDGVQDLHRRPLDDLIFQRRDADGPLTAIRLRDVDPRHGARMVRSPLEPVGQLPQVCLQVVSISRPWLTIDPRGRVPVEAVVRLPQAIDVVDMVPQRRQRRHAVPPRRCP
jgi:hypothetical protein